MTCSSLPSRQRSSRRLQQRWQQAAKMPRMTNAVYSRDGQKRHATTVGSRRYSGASAAARPVSHAAGVLNKALGRVLGMWSLCCRALVFTALSCWMSLLRQSSLGRCCMHLSYNKCNCVLKANLRFCTILLARLSAPFATYVSHIQSAITEHGQYACTSVSIQHSHMLRSLLWPTVSDYGVPFMSASAC